MHKFGLHLIKPDGVNLLFHDNFLAIPDASIALTEEVYSLIFDDAVKNVIMVAGTKEGCLFRGKLKQTAIR